MKRLLVLLSVFFFFSSAYADLSFSPYAGADIGYRHLGFKTNKGDKEWKAHNKGGNIFLGAKFNDFVGAEVGVHMTHTTWTGFNSHYMFAGFVHLIGFLPVYDDVELFTGLGATKFKINYEALMKDYKASSSLPHVVCGVIYKYSDKISFRLTHKFDFTKRVKHELWLPKNSNSVHAGMMLHW